MASALTTTSASGANSRISGALRHRLSAVPCWKPSRSSWPRRGWRISRPPVVRSRSHGRPLARWSLSEMVLYCWAIHTSDRPALWALESGKSISRCVPANGTAGLARVRVRSSRRPPAPPARTRTSVRMRGTCGSFPRAARQSPGLDVARELRVVMTEAALRTAAHQRLQEPHRPGQRPLGDEVHARAAGAVVLERPAAVDRHRPLHDVRAERAPRLELAELDDLVPLARADLRALAQPVALARRALRERLDLHLRVLPGRQVGRVGHVREDLGGRPGDGEVLLNPHASRASGRRTARRGTPGRRRSPPNGTGRSPRSARGWSPCAARARRARPPRPRARRAAAGPAPARGPPGRPTSA